MNLRTPHPPQALLEQHGHGHFIDNLINGINIEDRKQQWLTPGAYVHSLYSVIDLCTSIYWDNIGLFVTHDRLQRNQMSVIFLHSSLCAPTLPWLHFSPESHPAKSNIELSSHYHHDVQISKQIELRLRVDIRQIINNKAQIELNQPNTEGTVHKFYKCSFTIARKEV